MNPIWRIFLWYSDASRAKRRRIFRSHFDIDTNTKILDLGSEDGSNIAKVLEGTAIIAENVYIADIDNAALRDARENYGFTPVLLDESGLLPFEDGFFDIVYCSSVLEHVTIPKDKVWTLTSGREFRERALESQARFAAELARIGKQYFVQTPCRSFPIESHSWLPAIALLAREIMVPLFRLTNKIWIKQTIPDFYLLSGDQLQTLFPKARIVNEKSFGLTKSLMAIRTNKQ
ncbi:MAG: methyltransferase domain-containing protein [Pyrinomonadaceae bacterium]